MSLHALKNQNSAVKIKPYQPKLKKIRIEFYRLHLVSLLQLFETNNKDSGN